ncbi:BTAD domain-containing putative transcriptional regulator [Streptomyces sp. NPDC019531]|uniref:AfsR/SARP family transcriptional regulator n=1 Tax=Streptomyces sp. NPDC019531 TaxID=3365062 RepID=UPI00384B67F7
MQFKILGPIETVVSDQTVTPQPAKIRAVLALLCAHSGSVVSRKSLVDALWNGHPPRTARTALQVYVSKLRKHLDEHADLANRLVTRPHGYSLDLETGELDLDSFDRLVREAQASSAEGRPRDALRCLESACALWRGPALADLRGSEPFDTLARQLDERRIDALDQRIGIQLALGQHTHVISELYGLVAQYPTWEAVHEHLMLSLYRSGRVAESLDVYRMIRLTLVHALGLEPGDRIQRLQRSILSRDPELDEIQLLSAAWSYRAQARIRHSFSGIQVSAGTHRNSYGPRGTSCFHTCRKDSTIRSSTQFPRSR